VAFDRVVQSGISTQRIGAANMQGLTLFKDIGPDYHLAPDVEATENAMAGVEEGSPHLWLAALLVLVAALWIVNQHYKFGVFNLAFIVLVVMASSVLLKTVFGKFHVPGLSQVVLSA
jgi:hypothetical protein